MEDKKQTKEKETKKITSSVAWQSIGGNVRLYTHIAKKFKGLETIRFLGLIDHPVIILNQGF